MAHKLPIFLCTNLCMVHKFINLSIVNPTVNHGINWNERKLQVILTMHIGICIKHRLLDDDNKVVQLFFIFENPISFLKFNCLISLFNTLTFFWKQAFKNKRNNKVIVFFFWLCTSFRPTKDGRLIQLMHRGMRTGQTLFPLEK